MAVTALEQAFSRLAPSVNSLLVHVDANMVNGWPLPFCGLDRGSLCGPVYATTSNGEASQLHPIYALGLAAAIGRQGCAQGWRMRQALAASRVLSRIWPNSGRQVRDLKEREHES
jgi:hypothetical protein